MVRRTGRREFGHIGSGMDRSAPCVILQLAKAAGCWNRETTAKDGLRTKAELGVQLRPITSTLATVAHGTFVGRARRDRRVNCRTASRPTALHPRP